MVTTGGGGITATAGRDLLMNGGSVATLGGGDISVTAERNIEVGSGSITTVAGGNIAATATTGSVDTGTDTGGYQFNNVIGTSLDPIYQVAGVPTADNPYAFPGALGGISTGAGGNVNITAGLDIISLLPDNVNRVTTDAGSGAFGGGNVTLTAGRNVVGHYVLANGTGTITAGNNAGTTATDPGFASSDPQPTPQEELALSLITGNWTVNAANNINFAGGSAIPTVFTTTRATVRSRGYHLFDYAAGDSCDSRCRQYRPVARR